tara:strand:+ start:230 stop:715 length:486 start_codon:yes stop_codon:yes gene_type:complete
MKTIYVKSARKVMQNKKELEDKLKVKISVNGNDVTITGKELNEYFASRVLEAIDYPFLVEDALLLKDENFLFEVIDIKSHTKRTDLGVIKGRIIGRSGKTLKVLSDLTGCEVVVKDNHVAIIGNAENIEHAQQAVISLIKGSKQGNVYGTLERANKRKRRD